MEDDRILRSARKAADDHSWQEALDGFLVVDARHPLTPADLDLLSEAAFWAGDVATAVDARQRAYARHIGDGHLPEAAWSALVTSLLHTGRGDRAVATGWFGRGQRLLADLPECAAHALLAWLEAQFMLRSKALDQALEKAREVETVARRLGAKDLVALGTSMQGFLRARIGDASGGFALIDEALTSAVAGELGPLATAEIFCEMVVSSLEVADYERAAEWLDTAERAGRTLVCFPGCCRVHRATVLRHHGEWPAARREAERGRAEVAGVEVEHEGMALTELGELYRYRGEVALARQAFEGAHERGWPPQPGLSLLRLETGDVDGALRMIGRVVDWSSDEPATLVHLLPAQVEIALAAGDATVVQGAAARLAEVASTLGSSTATAASACVAGLLLQQRGELTAAARQFELSVRGWRQARSPYDAAQAQMRLADVLFELGDPDSAKLELTAARRTFERLGAAPEARRAVRRLGEDIPLRATRTFMFTDVVNSTSLLSVMGDEAWDGVLRWHDRTVSAIVDEHRGRIVKGTGDGFFIVFEEPAVAVDAAIAIQRALDAHRRSDGFAPAVRIGLHDGSALQVDEDYSGQDVVVAARISALAGADEVLVSRAVADRVGPHVALVERGTTELKGIPAPVEISAVEWH